MPSCGAYEISPDKCVLLQLITIPCDAVAQNGFWHEMKETTLR